VGAACFVTASSMFFTLSYPIQQRQENRVSARFLAMLNIIGSMFFVLSALGAYIVPLTDQSIYPEVANVGTFIGAIFFFISSIPGLPPKRTQHLQAPQ
jgi:predicted PurR-regulated permease PerM